ncbi:MAG TPA: DUF1254 domain-containing protein [Gaiellaceae bacterium]
MSTVTERAVTLDAATAQEIAIEGYTYLYPLVLMDLTRRQMTNVEHVGERVGRGPADVFVNIPAFPPAEFRDVVRPNFDTLYSIAWLDLRKEPRIVSVPAAKGDYYLLPMYDMFGEVFTSPGTRTTGGEAADFAIVGPGFTGELPEGVRRYNAPSSWVWIVGRTQASVETYEQVHEFQAGLRITPLSVWPGEPSEVTGVVDPSIDDETPPLRQVFALDAGGFFGYAAELLREHGPHAMDYPILDRLARIGFHAGEPFDLTDVDVVARKAFEQAVPAAQQKVTEFQHRIGVPANGWQLLTNGMGTYGTDYLRRACVELIGLGANLPEDAIYPLIYVDVAGQPFDGANRYVWHLEADELPPVHAFWSLTLYDDEGFQVANELDRFAIGDRNHLEFNTDGSLDIHIQHDEPSSGTSNWLPAPKGSFNLCARLYYPKPELLDGTWAPAALTRVA